VGGVPDLSTLNGLDREAFAATVTPCCGARRWVEALCAARPFTSAAHLYATADRVWRELDAADWREAFTHHPRIGQMPAAAGAWSRQEQRGVESAAAHLRTELARGNAEYERRFGWIFLICATGKSADEMLAALHERLHNDPATELQVAASEHARIMRLRLEKLLQA
jgi:2-oxo-4-hydroxy-4-carboxy-5-ureidoimidazoline decarboxylase